jgi:D-aminopeptidase
LSAHCFTPSGRPRARALGIPFKGEPGLLNSICDVRGFEVGYKTLMFGDGVAAVRTGVTALHPRGRANPLVPVTAGFFSLAGNGDATGTHWIDDMGVMSMPITLTNTFDVGTCHRAVYQWCNTKDPAASVEFGSPVVLETYDGLLSQIAGQHLKPEHVLEALDGARNGPVEEGAVGGGTGMVCFGYKAGSGTASRRLRVDETQYVVASFVQANFGRRRELTIAGIPVDDRFYLDDPFSPTSTQGDGSCLVVIATDAPLLAHQCRALAKRGALGLARLGSNARIGSGELLLALSTAEPPGISGPSMRRTLFVASEYLNPLFDAAAQATEEAILNAMVAAQAMTGMNGLRVPALPHDLVQDLVRRRSP